MCKQLKTGYTDCPHVHSDHDIIPCNEALELQAAKIEAEDEDEAGNTFCETITWEWTATTSMGKCSWCETAEGDSGRAERRRKKKFGVDEQGKEVKEKKMWD
jgi:hypothetical protein